MSVAAEIHREIFDCWNSRNFSKMRELLHPEYSYTGADGKEASGPEAGMAIAHMYASAFPDARLTLGQVHVVGDTAVAEVVARGTHGGDLMGIPPTGKKVEIRICNIVDLRDGKVYREREYMDMLTMMVQLGVVTPPGS